ncbi:MAG: LLM class flavin-dependent oxidoreductase [Thermoproteota archaeon]|jgi:5,10-methylenetetrahydromethanopterin reductase|nr:LLM class flavin-dependent oxidoreductase [Thermoproteota archaeon]
MTIARVGYSLGMLKAPEEMLSAGKQADRNENTHSLWVSESWGREAFSSLGALSQITRKVRLGSSIVSIYSRPPSTIAMSAATVDILSHNRMIIGLGASTPILAENWHGSKFEHPLQRMKEYIECIRLILTGKRVNYEGKTCRVRNFKLAVELKRQNIPIIIAAVNPKMIFLSTSIADGVLLYLRPDHELRKVVAAMRSRRKGLDFEIACVFITAVSEKDPQKGRDKAAKTLAFYVSVGKYYNKFLAENGFRKEVENITYEYQNNGLQAASKLVTDRMLDSLTICGNREQCIKSINKFMATGISLPIIQINAVDDDADRSIKDVISAFN